MVTFEDKTAIIESINQLKRWKDKQIEVKKIDPLGVIRGKLLSISTSKFDILVLLPNKQSTIINLLKTERITLHPQPTTPTQK